MSQKSKPTQDSTQGQRADLRWSNDRAWQNRSDDWVKASHESRKRKEAARRARQNR